LKSFIQRIFQRSLGLPRYLKLFAWFKIKTLHNDKGENDFFYFVDQLPDDGIILDIGANIGIMTYYLSKHTSKGKVFAYEPMPSNLIPLRWVIKFFGLSNVQLFETALGNETGSIEMVLPEVDHVKKQGLSHVISDDITEFNDGERFTTTINKLDNLLVDEQLPINGIKIDVENFEYQVFLGAEKILNTHKPIIYCELWDNDNRYKCFDYLTDLGYQIMVKQGNGLERYNEKNHQTQNFFFIHE